jgi:H+/gluconate symporter-like permease
MSEPLHSFVVSVSCIVGVAVLIPLVEMLARRLRRNSVSMESPEIVRLTPARPSYKRNSF